MSKADKMSSRDLIILLVGLLMSAVGGFQGYVVADLNSELAYIKEEHNKKAALIENRISNIETTYVMNDVHVRDMQRIEERIKIIDNKVYLWRRED